MAQNSDRMAARRAVADWLTSGNIRGVDVVHMAYPLRLDFNGYGSGDHRCQLVVIVDNESEDRRALGGRTSGKKRIDYLVSVEVYHRSTTPDPVAALDHFDMVVDGIKARLREDRMLGQTDDAIVWQAAEGVYGLQVDFMVPENGPWLGGEALEYYANFRFEVSQWITH